MGPPGHAPDPYTMSRYWLRLARALAHQRRFEEALAALHRETVPVTHHLTYLAAVLARLGRRQEARAVVGKIEKAGARVNRRRSHGTASLSTTRGSRGRGGGLAPRRRARLRLRYPDTMTS